MHTNREVLYHICSKNCEISNFGFVSGIFFFSLTWDHMGVKVSNDISSEENTSDLLPKIYVFSWGGSQSKLLKNSEILNF